MPTGAVLRLTNRTVLSQNLNAIQEEPHRHDILLNLLAQQAGVVSFAGCNGSMNEVRGTNRGGGAFVAEVLAKAGGCILKREIAGGTFGVKRGDCGVGAAVVMLKGIQ